MFQDFMRPDRFGATTFEGGGRSRGWSVLLPFFNERDYLRDTVASLAGQSEPPFLILIDNGSSDGSAEVAVEVAREYGVPHLLVHEPRPGKVAALAAGLPFVATPYVATCDADTWYPPHYLAAGQALLEQDGRGGAGAYFVSRRASVAERAAGAFQIQLVARLFPGQCHAGGAGQVFRTSTLRRAGGFDPARWNLVLEDHEVIHRLLQQGSMGYGAALWCAPAPRKRDRASVRWTVAERLCYLAMAARAGDWFFYDYLARRLIRRKLSSDRLRERRFQAGGGSPAAQEAFVPAMVTA
ncbi:MAG: glycosyltransferase family 2 protein [Candidatus Sphingomonas colombiensis]|nr:glycosyltransferase family 2 protein [Sphingomonas sp.]WEK41943.1 MAG: glycosyltransferase family 2 protein [Sphingomonas sp.]